MDYATIGIIGKSTKSLLAEIESVRQWDGGHNYPIRVEVNGNTILDSIDDLETAVKGELHEYIEKNFGSKKTIVKSGGDDDLYLVQHPDYFNDEGKFHKVRHKPTNITPKKKKRRK